MKLTKQVARMLIIMIDAAPVARKMPNRADASAVMTCEEKLLGLLKEVAIDKRRRVFSHHYRSDEEIVRCANAIIEKISRQK